MLWRLGLLRQKKCCISWYHYRDFLEEFGDTLPVADQLFVIDGKRITCSGGIGVAYLAAHIVELRMGRFERAEGAPHHADRSHEAGLVGAVGAADRIQGRGQPASRARC